jgi:uncharacterized protein
MTTYVISKKFTSSVERSPRVLEIAEAFGLGLSSKEFIVYDNLAIDVEQGDVVYITGQSGSGKSLLLRDLVDQMRAGGLKVTDLNEITLEEKPVIELVGKTTGEAAEILAKAGISDAWIYIRKPSELSDGQRYRLKLAIVMNSDADVWVADEFGAVLDRVTARVVAFSMAKVARRAGKTFMVATTHNDMIAELAPSLMITKRFREKVEIATKLDSHEAAA